MKTKLIACAALLAAIGVSAHAGDAKDMKELAITPVIRSDAGFYVAAYGGAQFAQDRSGTGVSFDPTGTSFDGVGARKLGTSTSDSWGAVGGLKFGYKFESYPIDGDFALQPAVESDIYYVGAKTKTSFYYPNDDLTATVHTDSLAALVNGIVRFKTPTSITPYLGVGVGLEYTVQSGGTISNPDPGDPAVYHFHSDNLSPAVQALAGFDYEIVRDWDLFTEYKYLVAIDTQFSSVNFDGNGDSYTSKTGLLGQHIITAGVKYNF